MKQALEAFHGVVHIDFLQAFHSGRFHDEALQQVMTGSLQTNDKNELHMIFFVGQIALRSFLVRCDGLSRLDIRSRTNRRNRGRSLTLQ